MVEPECRMGYTNPQIEEIMGDRIQEFWKWMDGQTMAVCDGFDYSHELGKYVKSACDRAHGSPIVYPWDVERFLKGLPIVD